MPIARWLRRGRRGINAAHARQRGPGEQANAQLKSWQVLRKIRSCPRRATALVKAVTVLIQTGLDQVGKSSLPESLYGPDHFQLLRPLVDVGDLTAATSGREAARPFYDRALAISAARRGADPPDTTSLADHVRDLLDQPT